MKTPLACLALILLLASCAANTTQSRISRNGGMYSMLSNQHRQLVASGQVTKGMSKDAVYLAWGTPSKVYQFEDDGVKKERWVYTRSRPTHTTSVGLGYGGFPRYGRWGYHGCVDYGPRTVYIPEQYAQVIFNNGEVESWEKQQ